MERKKVKEEDKEIAILTRIKRSLIVMLSQEFVIEVFVSSHVNFDKDDVWIKFFHSQLAQKVGDQIIEYPKNWKEAFKERWLPEWLKKRFPIKYKKYEILAIFPDLIKEIPKVVRDETLYFTFAEEERILPD